MKISRRRFLLLSGAALQVGLLAERVAAAPTDRPADGPPAPQPWHQRIRRIGQVNFNERDPQTVDVEEWADYWASLKVDAVLVSVTGIIAFYPTEVRFHRRSRYLGNRDLFGSCAAAAKRRGLRVIARLSPDLNWDETLQARPEWFIRNADGSYTPHAEDRRLHRTCMFSGYFTEYVPAVMREVQARYDVDGLFCNGWPPLDGLPVCYCAACRKLAPPKSVAYWDQFTERTVELWKLFDSIAKEKGPDNLFFANLGGGERATPNLKRLAQTCAWFNCDNQGRGGDPAPIWGAAHQGRVATAVMGNRTITNVTGAYSTGSGTRWRNVAKSRPEAEIWMDQTVASGMTIWYHWVGAQAGLGEDRRWQAVGRDYFGWLARHDRHFVRRRSLADVAVVIGQRTSLFHVPPGPGGQAEFIDGLYYALLEGRFLFDFVHEDDLGPETLGRYSALLLPNIAWMSDRQCAQVWAYAEAGGSVLATFETAMYDENGRRRANSGLAELFDLEVAGNVAAPNGNGFYARLAREHDLLRGLTETNWIPGGAYRLPIKAPGEPILTVVPAYPDYPPELSYASEERTDEPAAVIRERGRSRLAYFPADLERAAWRSGHTDLTRLIQNSVAWVARGRQSALVEGEGLVECFAWETEPGFSLHLLNYTNPNLHRGWLRRHYPIGPQRVRMALPAGRTVERVELLRSERDVPFVQQGTLVEFTVPGLVDYEVAALHAAGQRAAARVGSA